MKTSAAGRKAITAREGNKLTAYKDSVGVLTIGVGHTSAAGAPKVTSGMKITAAQSDEILSRDLATFEAAVNKAVKVPLNQNEFDALVSLAFNIGAGAFSKSTLVRKLNAGDRRGAADQFLVWNKAGGKVLKGLKTRRAAERAQFLTGASKVAPAPAPAFKVTKSVVEMVQRRLAELNYNPGGIDGIQGSLTDGAILSFKSDHGLSTTVTIDEMLISALASATPRELKRAETKPAEVTAKVPEAKAHWWNKWLGGSTAAASAIAGVADATGGARGYIEPLRTLADGVPGWVWLGLVAIVALSIFVLASRGEAKSVEAFQTGDRR